MTLTLVTINHTIYADYWSECIHKIDSDDLISIHEINLNDFWSTNSHFDWDSELQNLIQSSPCHRLLIIASNFGAIFLKHWLKNNQDFLTDLPTYAIFIDSPPLEQWLTTNPLDKLVQMDRASYADHFLNLLKEQSAPQKWIDRVLSEVNYLKAEVMEVYRIFQSYQDHQLWIPRLETWHEIESVSTPVPVGLSRKVSRRNIPGWYLRDFFAPKLAAVPTTDLSIQIQHIIANNICDREQ